MSKKHHKKNKPVHESASGHADSHGAEHVQSAPHATYAPHMRESAPRRSVGEDLLGWVGVIVLLAILAVNIAYSQMIHPLYQGVIDGNKNSLVTFFKIAKDLPAFQPLKPEMQNSYKLLAKEIDGENITRQEKIKKVEALLVQYPKSRDLLYAASVLYHDIGNPIKSEEYLKKAQEIDPSVQ